MLTGCSKQVHIFRIKEYRSCQSLLQIPDQARNLQYLLDHEPQFAMLNFSGITFALTADQQAFIDTYKKQELSIRQQ